MTQFDWLTSKLVKILKWKTVHYGFFSFKRRVFLCGWWWRWRWWVGVYVKTGCTLVLENFPSFFFIFLKNWIQIFWN